MAAIRELSGYPLGFPSEGKLQIWKFTSSSEGLRFDFNFNPVLDLSSPASAFRFFFDRLSEVDSGVGEEIVGRIATFALDQVGTSNWICGLFLLVVLETVPMRIDGGKKSENRLYTKEVNEEGECCSICLKGFMKGTMVIPLLPCLHRFHNGCIIPWLRNNTTCPVCRCTCTLKSS
nr:E3 ubiquitin-protein ligase At4g11680-like [Ipomoea trifida]